MCCRGGGVRGVRKEAVKTVMYNKSRGVKAQKITPIQAKSFGRGTARKTCPKCGFVMSHSVLSYDPLTKTAKQLWTCTNGTCKHKIKK